MLQSIEGYPSACSHKVIDNRQWWTGPHLEALAALLQSHYRDIRQLNLIRRLIDGHL